MPHQTTLTWNAPVTGDPATSFDVQRAPVAADGTVGAFTSIGAPTATTFIDVNVVPGNKYEYRVASVNAAGESSFITSPVVTTPLAAPQALSNLQVAAA